MTASRIAQTTILLVLQTAAFAQTSPGNLTVDVPFAFFAAGQSFDAGHYILQPAGDGLIRIYNSKTVGLFAPTHAAERSSDDETKVVFHRYGERYFLSAVWIKGNRLGRELLVSKAEKETAQHSGEMKLAMVRPAQ